MAPGVYGEAEEHEEQAHMEEERAIEDAHAEEIKSLRKLAGVDHQPSTKFERFLSEQGRNLRRQSERQLVASGSSPPFLDRASSKSRSFIEPRGSIHAAAGVRSRSHAGNLNRNLIAPSTRHAKPSEQQESKQQSKQLSNRGQEEQQQEVGRADEMAELMSSVRQIARELSTLRKETQQNSAALEALTSSSSQSVGTSPGAHGRLSGEGSFVLDLDECSNRSVGSSAGDRELSVSAPRAGGRSADRSFGETRPGLSQARSPTQSLSLADTSSSCHWTSTCRGGTAGGNPTAPPTAPRMARHESK